MTGTYDIIGTVTDTFQTKAGNRESHFLVGRLTDRRWQGAAVKLQLTADADIKAQETFKDKVVEVSCSSIKEDWRGDLIGQVATIKIAK
jgi:hypothetical protein